MNQASSGMRLPFHHQKELEAKASAHEAPSQPKLAKHIGARMHNIPP